MATTKAALLFEVELQLEESVAHHATFLRDVVGVGSPLLDEYLVLFGDLATGRRDLAELPESLHAWYTQLAWMGLRQALSRAAAMPAPRCDEP